MTEPTIVDKPSDERASLAAPTFEFKAPVVEVTLLGDRAHVVRRGTIELHGGMTRLRVAGVAPVLADKTLCAAVAVAGQKLGVLSESMFSIIVIMVILTTLVTPPVLTFLLKQQAK